VLLTCGNTDVASAIVTRRFAWFGGLPRPGRGLDPDVHVRFVSAAASSRGIRRYDRRVMSPRSRLSSTARWSRAVPLTSAFASCS
jgi:hypothetical protein